jgi:hypothetical protein
MMRASSSDSTPSVCPFCGQPLVDHEAVSHLERAQASFEQDVRAAWTAESEQRMQERVAAAAAAAKKAEQAKLVAVESQLERERSEHNELKKRRTAERLKLEKTIKEATQRDFARREKALERTLTGLREHNEELERKVEHLTAQDRGDLNEVNAVEKLKQAFPADRIEKKGRGGDVLHTVQVKAGGIERRAGLILYECKDTMRWGSSFIAQIKRDGQTHKTPYLVLVTKAFPRGERWVCVRDGVVVVHPAYVVYIAEVMRRMVVDTHEAGQGAKGHREKTARLFEYQASPEFREPFAAVVHAADQLQELLHTERQAHERTWTRREHAYSELARKSTAIDESLRTIFEGDGRAQNGKLVALR